MAKGDTVTMMEAAAMLGVRKEKIARLVKKGVLSTRHSTIDARRRLISRAQVESILREEGYDSTNLPRPSRQPWPRTAGIYDGPVKVRSRDLEDYMREHWRPERSLLPHRDSLRS